MTRIRKINQSQVEGSDANQNDANKIRPLGEMAVYINENNNNKLELLMFDGERTHLRSKVLSKGTFYGGDSDSADSGIGGNYDTIKLIPDAQLLYNDNTDHRYLIIDPTGPNHIHIRAGGAIDNSNADLFLGGELTNVRVSDDAATVEINTFTGVGAGTNNWLFGQDGSLTLPGNLTLPGSGIVSDTNGTPGLTKKTYTANSGWFNNDSTWFETNATLVSTTVITGTVNETLETAVPGYAEQLYGYFKAPSTATYTFGLAADDAGMFWIGDDAVDGRFDDANANITYVYPNGIGTYSVALTKDVYYPIRLQWGNNDGTVPNFGQVGQFWYSTTGSGVGAIDDFTNTIYTDAGLTIVSKGGNEWTFSTDGKLTLSTAGIVRSGTDTAQVGSTITIATDSEGGTGAGTPGVVDVDYASNSDIISFSIYPAGSTITFNNGDVRTITTVLRVSGYIEISYSGATTTSSPEFPITLKTANYAAATTAPEWQFGTNGSLTFPDNTVQTTAPESFSFSVAGDDSTQRAISNNELIKFIGAGTITTASDAEGNITITGSGGSSLVNGIYTLSLGSTGNTTFPTGLRLSNARGSGTVNFLSDVDKLFQIETQTASTSKLWNFGTDGTLTVPGSIIGTATQNVFNTTSTTVNAFGAATTLNIGAAGGTTTIAGDLTVNGTTTTVNSTTLTVDDKNIELGSVATPTNTTADGGGITLKGATDKTFNWVNATSAWTSSEDLNLLTGKVYEINGVAVLSATALLNDASQTSVTIAGSATTALNIGASGAPITGFARTATTSSTAESLGYLGLPQSATATTASLAIGDTGKHIYVTTAGQTITIPANASVAYPIGSTITFIAGASATTVSIAISSDTMRLAGGALTGTRTLAANGMATAVKVAATTWYINGTGLT